MPEMAISLVPLLVAVGFAVFVIVMLLRIAKAVERTAAATEAVANEALRREGPRDAAR
ncbi:MAG: hypothetical protein ACLSVD_07215 [Eggerthellaceae bacterium]